jgi:Asp-tRNA(Asn)/Glu-tRNA(Gln) amidotransferase A subunit family amidase
VLDWFGNLWRNFAFTPLANLCGVPAISLPLAEHENGLPLGIQAQAKQANDGRSLPTVNLGDALDRVRRDWLFGLSSQVKASIDGRLIHDHQV